MIENFGKGYVHKGDPRDYIAMGSLEPVDFNVSTGLAEPPDEDQGKSLSCVEQALGYYLWAQLGDQITRKDLYSRVFLPQGGSNINTAISTLGQLGNYLREQADDPIPQTESNMRQKVYLQIGRKIFGISYWKPADQSIEGLAPFIKEYKGIVGAVIGNNLGWSDPNIPKHPTGAVPMDIQSRSDLWGHFLYFYDVAIVNGQPALKAKSSWCSWAKNHLITKEYFTSGWTYAFYVLEVKELSMNDFMFVVNSKGKIGIGYYIDTPENLVYAAKCGGVTIPVLKDGAGNPLKTADGHIQPDWNWINQNMGVKNI